MSIRFYDNETQTLWNRGQLPVMLKVKNVDRPIGFCDGSQEDENEVMAMAEEQGAMAFIHKKPLKTGRAVWIIESDTEEDAHVSDEAM